MPCTDADTLSAAVLTAASGPAKVSGDAGSVESHRLADLIEAEKYARAKCAASSPRRGLRFTQLIPPGSV